MLGIPEQKEFPIGKAASQHEWLDAVKSNGCVGCHAMGTAATRTVPQALGHFKSSPEAWARRITSGQAMTSMVNVLARTDADRMLAQFADWTDRVAAGELPVERPPRPQGVERNVVITLWDWSNPRAYLHDEVSTDKRNRRSTPTASSTAPRKRAPTCCRCSIRSSTSPPRWSTRCAIPRRRRRRMTAGAFAVLGATPIWDSHTTTHNPMFDERGRVWYTARLRPPQNPDFCRNGSTHPSAQVFPLERANRHLSMYDPQSASSR